MTPSEIMLSIITGLFTAKEIWMTVRNHKNKKTKVELAKINQDHSSIEQMKSNYQELKAKFRVMQQNHKEMKISFRVILPSLEKLIEDDPNLKGSFDVVKQYFEEES